MTATLTPRISTNRTPLQDVIPLATPYLVFLDPSDLCNFRCRFCPTGDRELVKRYRKPQFMDFGLYEKIIRDLSYMPEPIKVLRMYKDGEPLLNPALPAMIYHAKYVGRFLQIDTTTNGSLLNYRLSNELIDSGLDKLFVSVEGMGAEAYREFCGYKLDWQRFVASIEEFYWLSRDRCRLHVKIAGDYLTDAQREEFVQTFGEIADEIFIEHTAPCWPGFGVEGANSEVGIYGNRLTSVKVCPYPLYSLSINSNGTVSLCYLDWKHEMIVGDLKHETFYEIWNGDTLLNYRILHLQKRRGLLENCSTCGQLTHCMPDDIDAYAEEILKRMKP
jgi:radical SAM protein with 4Fe4S-binding SPASM domain